MNKITYAQLQGMVIACVLLCLPLSSTIGAGGKYAIISEKNLFRPDRSEWISDTPGSDAEEKTDPAQLELFGTIIVGDRRSALIYKEEKPTRKKSSRSSRSRRRRSSGREKAQLYHLGDYLGSYVVSAIHEKRVELDYYGDKEVLYLHEGKEPPKGDYTPLGVSQPRPRVKPKPKPAKRKTGSAQQQRKQAIQRQLGAGKVPTELKNVLAPEQLKKLLRFNKNLMRELKESGGNLDQRAIREKIESFRERFLEKM